MFTIIRNIPSWRSCKLIELPTGKSSNNYQIFVSNALLSKWNNLKNSNISLSPTHLVQVSNKLLSTIFYLLHLHIKNLGLYQAKYLVVCNTTSGQHQTHRDSVGPSSMIISPKYQATSHHCCCWMDILSLMTRLLFV